MNKSRGIAPTLVLVHGAFADAAGWFEVVERLQAAGATVVAAANPLRGLASDGEYIAGVARQIGEPVVLVGHSYGGAVITHAGSSAENVQGLVFIASFGIEQGQSVGDATAAFASPQLMSALTARRYSETNGNVTELSIRREMYAKVFAADVSVARTPMLAVSQRPVSAAALLESLQVEPAWRTLPSWFLIAAQDNVVNPDAQRAAAKRMGSIVTEVKASHAVMMSQPDAVANFILKAWEALIR